VEATFSDASFSLLPVPLIPNPNPDSAPVAELLLAGGGLRQLLGGLKQACTPKSGGQVWQGQVLVRRMQGRQP